MCSSLKKKKAGEIVMKFQKTQNFVGVNWIVGDGEEIISKALFMGDESAVFAEIEVPNENIPEPLERPNGDKSWGLGSTHPEAPREIKPGRGGILIASTADSETALGQKLEKLGCSACLFKAQPGESQGVKLTIRGAD